MLKLTADQEKSFLSFVGYGNLSAPIWFIGLEEGVDGQSNDDIQHNILARCEFGTTMDLDVAHRKLLSKGRSIEIENRQSLSKIPQPWWWMARIVGARTGSHRPCDRDSVERFVRAKLGRIASQKSWDGTFLTEMSPIPRRSLKDTRHKDLINQKNANVQRFIDLRAKTIRENAQRAELVVCYGWTKRDEFKSLLGIFDWQRPLPDSKIEKSADGRCLILPFLGNGQFSCEFGKSLIASEFFGRAHVSAND
jgi:hypothetical protein